MSCRSGRVGDEVGELLLAKDDVDEAKNVARESRDIFQDRASMPGSVPIQGPDPRTCI